MKKITNTINMERKTELLGFVGVDSGQLMITDPCYVKDFKSDQFKGDGSEKEGEYSYSGVCKTTMNAENGGPLKFAMGHEGAGVAFSTGGDGTYPVNAVYDEDGRIIKIEIVLIQENEDSN